jgi:glycosyltransferase involved in cell wall biosynthesis
LKALATELQIPWWDSRESKNIPSSATKKDKSLVFLGPQFGDDKSACYANCDAFILPSFSEGLPMVILEAWAYSKPVLMTPECNLPEGYAADAAIRIETDAASILNGLRTLTGMSCDILRRTGKNGRDLVVQRFTWQSVAAQLKTTYEWMLKTAPRPNWVLLS